MGTTGDEAGLFRDLSVPTFDIVEVCQWRAQAQAQSLPPHAYQDLVIDFCTT